MDGFKLGRLYKGEEYTMTLPVPFSGEVDDFQFLLFTDSATTVEIPQSQITIEEGVMEFTIQETDLDVLNDGVLNYYLKCTVGSTDKIQCTNTMHYLKSPSDYNPQTTQDIYNEGYEAGVEAGSGEYSDGFVDGEQAQKNKLTGITINQNGTYQREDGYNNVIVSVPQTQYNSQTKNYNLTSNGTTTITPDAGYDGITGGTITVNVPTGGMLQDKDTTIFSLQNGNRVYTITPDAGYDGMRSLDVELCSYSPSPFNMFSFVLYFDSTQDEYYIFDPLFGYNLQEVLDFKVDGLSDNPPYTFQKNTSHSFSLVAPNVTTLLENLKYAWPNGGYLVMWNDFTSYNDVVPALYVDGVDNMSYQTTNMTLIDSCVLGPVYAQNVLSLSFSGGNGEMLFTSKDSINFPNCNEIYIYDSASTPCVVNYHNGDKFTLAESGTVYVPTFDYISDMYNDDAAGRRKFVSLLPDGWTCDVIPSFN